MTISKDYIRFRGLMFLGYGWEDAAVLLGWSYPVGQWHFRRYLAETVHG